MSASLPPVPTFGYPGSKARLARKIVPLFPDADRYVEPFVGRGNIFWYVAQRRPYPKYWLNDKYLRFLPSVQQYGQWYPIAAQPHDKSEYERRNEQMRTDSLTKFKRKWEPEDSGYASIAPDGIYASPYALMEPILVRSGGRYGKGLNRDQRVRLGMEADRKSYIGLVGDRRHANCGNGFALKPSRAMAGFERRVRLAAEIMRRQMALGHHIRLTFLHWREVLKECGEGDFVYLDPPYGGAQVGSYAPLPDTEYEELVDTLLNAKFGWGLSEYENPIYKRLTQKFGQPARFSVPISMTHDNGKREAIECLWTNCLPSSQQSRETPRGAASGPARKSVTGGRNNMQAEITVDPEFRSLIPPLSDQELALLRQQILAKGCLEPLYVWNNGGNRVLLDGHNRHRICTENRVPYKLVEVPRITSREGAKLWILEHQAGRRNLTDDQRAVVWNDIREARSKLAVAEKMRKARRAKESGSMSAKTTDIEPAKRDTRKEIALEAKVPENKLRQAQALKRAAPHLYEDVRTGASTMRAARKSLGTRPNARAVVHRHHFSEIARALQSVFNGGLRHALDGFAQMSRGEITPAHKQGLRHVAATLDDLSETADRYAAKLRAVLRSAKKAT